MNGCDIRYRRYLLINLILSFYYYYYNSVFRKAGSISKRERFINKGVSENTSTILQSSLTPVSTFNGKIPPHKIPSSHTIFPHLNNNNDNNDANNNDANNNSNSVRIASSSCTTTDPNDDSFNKEDRCKVDNGQSIAVSADTSKTSSSAIDDRIFSNNNDLYRDHCRGRRLSSSSSSSSDFSGGDDKPTSFFVNDQQPQQAQQAHSTIGRTDRKYERTAKRRRSSCFKRVDFDEDELFLMSLLPTFKKLDDSCKVDLKVDFLNAVKRVQERCSNRSTSSIAVTTDAYYNDRSLR